LTRLELVAVLASLALVAALAFPVLANTRQRSDRVVCISNLQRIGQAFHAWAIDHDDRMMWAVDARSEGTMVPPGGPQPPWNGLQNLAWFQYSWISNELVFPQYLVCPADTSKHPARNWGSTDPSNGYRHNNQQNNSISYDLWLHASPAKPSGFLCSDRNLSYDAFSSSCSTGVAPAWEIQPGTTVAAWSASIHPTNGNVLLFDGSVAQVDTAGLRKLLLTYPATNAEPEHYLSP